MSRGAVTGGNHFFVLTSRQAEVLGLQPYVVPVIRSAREVFSSQGQIGRSTSKWVLLDPPKDLDLAAGDHSTLRRYLRRGEASGVHDGYICRHRRPWWRVGSKQPPVVATYMARQPPAFALNPERLAILNVLHGLFPRIPLDDEQLLGLVQYLNRHRTEMRGAGRTYQGGLEKFEPSEMEALLVPPPERLSDFAKAKGKLRP